MTTSARLCPKCGSNNVEPRKHNRKWICNDCDYVWQEEVEATTHDAAANVSPIKIFLSYGRLDTSDFAEKLTADLKLRGYEVWRDTGEIRAGKDWPHEICKGIDTARIVVALMSPHSVRTTHAEDNPADIDSICLDEIAYARFHSPSHPIIPIMTIKCDPPLIIYTLDYIDMTRWKGLESQYQAGLERLLTDIEDASQGKKPRYKGWSDQLQPWDFAAFLYDKRKNFTGRQWLFDVIDNWRKSSGAQQTLLITGNPGVGKSAIVAQLVHDNVDGQVIAYHCCQYNLLATLEPWRFVRSIAAMIASRLPEYAEQLNDPALSEILSEDSCRQDPGSAFDRGVLTALHTLPAPTDGVRYILIDALDEALTQSSESTIVNLLATSISRLPVWLRIVATTRKEPAVLRQLQGLPSYELKADDPQSVKDLKEYILYRLSTGNLQRELVRIAGESVPSVPLDAIRTRVVEALVKCSGGNFLYVRHALDEIESPLSAFDQKKIFSLNRLDELPDGLSGMYELYFQRQFGTKAEHYSDVKKILEVICGAREPLEETVLATAAGFDKTSDFLSQWRMLAQFLPARNEPSGETTYAPFHKSLTDWLTSGNARRNSVFGIQSEEGDRRLANWSWDRFTKLTKRSKASLPDQYWVRHGAAHLLRTCDHLHGEQSSSDSAREKYEDIIRSVSILGWLNGFPESKNIIASALPLLAIILSKTESDLDSDDNMVAETALQALGKMDEQKLFDLVKHSCATDIMEMVLCWIGRTQKAGWRELIPQMLELNEYVLRYAAGCGQAARYARLQTDGEDILAATEIADLLNSSDMNEQEMGSYAVGEIAKSQIPDGITPQISQWLSQISATDIYFCQSVIGDLLLNLTLQNEHQRVAELDQSGAVSAFWDPIWQYTRLDVVSVLALRKEKKQGLSRDVTRFQAEIEREGAAIQTREKRIINFEKDAGAKGPALARMLRKIEIDDADNDIIRSWLTRDGLDSRDPDHRVCTAVEFLQLMFTHPLWQICEKGSAILPLLGENVEWRDTCIQILDRLLGSLDPSKNAQDPWNWRVILGTCEACYLIRHFDPGHEFVSGQHTLRLEHCWKIYYDHWNCHVRALLAENIFFVMGEMELGRGGWETGRATKHLENCTEVIDYWLLDQDVWVLEHVYQAFRIIAEKQITDETLKSWAEKRFAYVMEANPTCLLARVSQTAGKPWVELERGDFLKKLQTLRRSQPFLA